MYCYQFQTMLPMRNDQTFATTTRVTGSHQMAPVPYLKVSQFKLFSLSFSLSCVQTHQVVVSCSPSISDQLDHWMSVILSTIGFWTIHTLLHGWSVTHEHMVWISSFPIVQTGSYSFQLVKVPNFFLSSTKAVCDFYYLKQDKCILVSHE